MADLRTAMDVLNRGCREEGVCPGSEQYYVDPEEGQLTEREERVAERAAVQAAELTASRIAEQVAKELSGEVLHSSPISPHCEAVLAKPPLCHDFRAIRSFALCRAWQIMDQEKRTSLPMSEAWAEARQACRRD